MPSPGVHGDENKPHKMPINARPMALSLAVPAEGACKQDCKLGAV